MSDAATMEWREIYERLARRRDRPDALAMASLERRVRAWTPDDDLAATTCAEVWRTFNLSRGGASFEGFVQGRFLEVAEASRAPDRRAGEPLPPSPLARARGKGDSAVAVEDGLAARGGRLAACLAELRARNARHHDVITLLYEDRATVPETAEELAIDVWTVRALAARARQALAECLARAERREARGADRQDGGGDGGRRGTDRGGPPRRPGRQSPGRRSR